MIFTSPNFQFVRSIVSVYGPSNGIRDFRYLATASKSSTICAMKRWMRRKLDSLDALLSNAAASLDKQTVLYGAECSEQHEKAFDVGKIHRRPEYG